MTCVPAARQCSPFPASSSRPTMPASCANSTGCSRRSASRSSRNPSSAFRKPTSRIATFVENALAKARHASAQAKLPGAGRRFRHLRARARRRAGRAERALCGRAEVRRPQQCEADRGARRRSPTARAHYACVLALLRHARRSGADHRRGRVARDDHRYAARHRRLRLRPALPRCRDRPHRRRAAARAEERAVASRQGDARVDRAPRWSSADIRRSAAAMRHQRR